MPAKYWPQSVKSPYAGPWRTATGKARQQQQKLCVNGEAEPKSWGHMCLPPLISHFLEIPVFANPNFPLPTGDSIKNTFYSLQTNSCTSPYTAKSYSLTWFRRQNKHYVFVSKGKSWSSKPICHWLYSETHLMANSSLHLHNHVRCTPRARCSSRHTDLPTYLLQYTNAIFCPVI